MVLKRCPRCGEDLTSFRAGNCIETTSASQDAAVEAPSESQASQPVLSAQNFDAVAEPKSGSDAADLQRLKELICAPSKHLSGLRLQTTYAPRPPGRGSPAFRKPYQPDFDKHGNQDATCYSASRRAIGKFFSDVDATCRGLSQTVSRVRTSPPGRWRHHVRHGMDWRFGPGDIRQ